MKFAFLLSVIFMISCSGLQKNNRRISSDSSGQIKLSISCEDELRGIKSLENIVKNYALQNDSKFGSFIITYVKKVGGIKAVMLSDGRSVDCSHILGSLDKDLIQKVTRHLDPLGDALKQFNVYGETN